MDTRFHAVYLLTSDDPTCKGMYYVGYTVDPLRRLQQHNGEKQNGAWRTKRRGQPWRMVCCVSGFSEDRAALKFEWMWQHAPKSLDIREQTKRLLEKMKYKRNVFAGRALHGQHLLSQARTGLRYAIGILHILLRCDLFQPIMLQLNILEPEIFHSEQQQLPQDLCPPLRERRPLFMIRDPITKDELKSMLPNTGSAEASQQHQHQIALSQQFQGNGDHQSINGMGLPPTSYFSQQPLADTETRVGGGGGQNLETAFLTMEDEQRQIADEGRLASDNLLPCSLCGMALPPNRFVRCSSLLRHCDPNVFGNVNLDDGSLPLQLLEVDTFLGGPSGRCPFRAHVPCAAMWFYYSRRHWGDDEKFSRSNSQASNSQMGGEASAMNNASQGSAVNENSILEAFGVGPTPHALPPALAKWELIPTNAVQCPMCGGEQLLHWSALCHEVKQTMNAGKQRAEAKRRRDVDDQLAAQRERFEKAGLFGPPKAAKEGAKKRAATVTSSTETASASAATSISKTITNPTYLLQHQHHIKNIGPPIANQQHLVANVNDAHRLFQRSADEEDFLADLLGISADNSSRNSPPPPPLSPMLAPPRLPTAQERKRAPRRARSPADNASTSIGQPTAWRGRGGGVRSLYHQAPPTNNSAVLDALMAEAREAEKAWDSRKDGAGGGLGAQREEDQFD